MKIVDYAVSEYGMGDLLRAYGISLKEDFTEKERKKLRKKLEDYMIRSEGEKLHIDLKKIVLVIQGADEASYLYQYL